MLVLPEAGGEHSGSVWYGTEQSVKERRRVEGGVGDEIMSGLQRIPAQTKTNTMCYVAALPGPSETSGGPSTTEQNAYK